MKSALQKTAHVHHKGFEECARINMLESVSLVGSESMDGLLGIHCCFVHIDERGFDDVGLEQLAGFRVLASQLVGDKIQNGFEGQ